MSFAADAGTQVTGLIGNELYLTIKQEEGVSKLLTLKPGYAYGNLELVEISRSKDRNEKIKVRLNGKTFPDLYVGAFLSEVPNVLEGQRESRTSPEESSGPKRFDSFSSVTEMRNYVISQDKEILIDRCDQFKGLVLFNEYHSLKHEHRDFAVSLPDVNEAMGETLSPPKVSSVSPKEDYFSWRNEQKIKVPNRKEDLETFLILLAERRQLLCQDGAGRIGRCCGASCIALGTVVPPRQDTNNTCIFRDECGLQHFSGNSQNNGQACTYSEGESVDVLDFLNRGNSTEGADDQPEFIRYALKEPLAGECDEGSCKLCPDKEKGCLKFDLILEKDGKLSCLEIETKETEGKECNGEQGTCSQGKCMPHPVCPSNQCSDGQWNSEINACEFFPKNEGDSCSLENDRTGVCFKGKCTSCKASAPNETLPKCPISDSWPCREGRRVSCNEPNVCDYLGSAKLPNGTPCKDGSCWDGVCARSTHHSVQSALRFTSQTLQKNFEERPNPSTRGLLQVGPGE